MRHLRRLLVTAAMAATVTGGALAATPSAALAADAYPCGAPWQHPQHGPVQTCPDWSPDGWIPVYSTPFPNSQVIGQIYAPGADWYQCQMQTSGVHTLGSYQNNWWAITKADNGNWGYTPETYFQGGGNFERDAGLRVC